MDITPDAKPGWVVGVKHWVTWIAQEQDVEVGRDGEDNPIYERQTVVVPQELFVLTRYETAENGDVLGYKQVTVGPGNLAEWLGIERHEADALFAQRVTQALTATSAQVAAALPKAAFRAAWR